MPTSSLTVALLLIPVAVAQTQSRHEPQQPTVMTVCQIMEGLKDHDSHIVTIKGIFLPLAKGVGLFTQLAPMPPDTCLAPGTSLPFRIDTNAPDIHFLEHPPAGYQLDERSVREANAKINQIVRQNPNTAGFLVVIQGYLIVNQQGPAIPPNVDRHGWYPAKLIVQSYKSVEIAP